MRFTYEPHANRVVFGRGASKRVAEEVVRIGRRALVLSTPEQAGKAEAMARGLGELAAGVFAGAAMHVPVAAADEAAKVAAQLEADCTIALGGGSTIGLGKALALRQSLPTLAVPTTYAGSEVTPIWGLTEGGVKTTGRDPKVLPRIVIYDADLVDSLPPAMTVASGLNAIAHAMEGLYAVDGSPIISLMAEESLRALSRNLPRIAAGDDANARDDALYGSWLAGSVLGGASVALHHKLCHTLGGAFNMPHAQTHAAVLPHAIAYNAPAVPAAMARAARALDRTDPATGLYDLASGLGAEMALAKLGMPADGIERVIELALANPYPNPRPITADGLRGLLGRALQGLPPATSD